MSHGAGSVKDERKSRTKKRIACGIRIAGRRYSGIVLDVSVRGLFVQTNASPEVGSDVEVDLTPPGRTGERITLRARVARKRKVPPRLLTVAKGGVGLQVLKAPAAYDEFVASVVSEAELAADSDSATRAGTGMLANARTRRDSATRGGAKTRADSGTRASAKTRGEVEKRAEVAKPKAAPASERARLRVRVAETDGSRTKAFLVFDASEQEAREQVMRELDEGWKIVAVEPI